jgi:hypothetical protein
MKGWILFIVLLVGIGIGVTGALLGPDYLEPYLPSGMKAESEAIEGLVRAKQLERDRLLITVLTPKGAVLVTFHKKIAEINLLIEKGDLIALGLHGYKPFVSDPRITRVRKDESAPPSAGPVSESEGLSEKPAPGAEGPVNSPEATGAEKPEPQNTRPASGGAGPSPSGAGNDGGG